MPRDEPASGFAGGKRVNIDRAEFVIVGDSATAAAALQAGQIDIYDRRWTCCRCCGATAPLR